VNGKIYIGQTRQGLARRKGEHIHRFNLGERDHKLYRAMRKYGIEKFRFDIVCYASKLEDLDRLERQVIAEHNSFQRGYNMTCGGDSISEETRAKLSATLKGRKIPWYDKVLATRKTNRAINGPNNCPIRGSKSKLSKSYLVRKPDGTEQMVTGIRQFCRDNRLDHGTLFAVLAGKQRHHKGFSLIARFND
jgi:group I intron endonuclease